MICGWLVLLSDLSRPKISVRKLNRTLPTQSNFRLLVVRLGAMGDILHALPAVTALRLAHPTWQHRLGCGSALAGAAKGRERGTSEQGCKEQGIGNREQGMGISPARLCNAGR